jgi:hypothetical protein
MTEPCLVGNIVNAARHPEIDHLGHHVSVTIGIRSYQGMGKVKALIRQCPRISSLIDPAGPLIGRTFSNQRCSSLVLGLYEFDLCYIYVYAARGEPVTG